jgi:hypothetical protein
VGLFALCSKNDGQLGAYKLVARALGFGEVGLRLQVLTKPKSLR